MKTLNSYPHLFFSAYMSVLALYCHSQHFSDQKFYSRKLSQNKDYIFIYTNKTATEQHLQTERQNTHKVKTKVELNKTLAVKLSKSQPPTRKRGPCKPHLFVHSKVKIQQILGYFTPHLLF